MKTFGRNHVHNGLRSAAILFLAASGSAAIAGPTLHKTADPFESVTWKVADDSATSGTISLSPDVDTSLAAVSKSSVDFKAAFSGTGFETLKCVPTRPLVIPGHVQKLTLWVRNRANYGWVVLFRDGQGRTDVGGKRLDWTIASGADAAWRKVTFDVPANWVQPIQIDGILTHNWDTQHEKGAADLLLDQFEADTDTSGVDETTGLLAPWSPAPASTDPKAPAPAAEQPTPLRSLDLVGTEQYNVFSGAKPGFLLTVRNWHASPITGSLKWTITDAHGAPVQSGARDLSVDDDLTLPLTIDTPKYGVYRLDTTIAWADGKKSAASQSYAVIPVAKPLTEAEKDTSPYGLNVLSARQPMVSTFRKAGIVWFRDYGFNFNWVTRAKGDDNRYAGWPYYPKIVRSYDENGARLDANLQTSIRPPAPGVTPGPDAAWTREVIGVMTAFPSIRAFELDNEYDLNGGHDKAEEAVGWKNYGLYHKKFGEAIQLMNSGHVLAVENGRAGIWPERLGRMVQSGDFAPIDVVNSHFYTGTYAPEASVVNYNMGFTGGESEMSFFDQLRAAKAAGSSDGKARQHWLTEFGWDTKAGPIVSATEQAAYLARAYMLLSAAGTSKGFWYWDLDSPVANQFFDGCGLFTFDQMPKVSYAAYAGLTQILPRAQYVGAIDAGPDTGGYLFRNDGKLVASLWTLDNKSGPKVDFGGASVYDEFANPLPAGGTTLGLEPVYAVGVPENSRWFRQSAYSLGSRHLVTATAGDTITADVAVRNDRASAIQGTARLVLPAGWTDVSGQTAIAVTPGQNATIPLKFRIGVDEPLGEKTVRVVVGENEPLTEIPVRVAIQRPIVMTVGGLSAEPGDSPVAIQITNRSAQPLDGTIRLHLPGSWSTATSEISVAALKPMETRAIPAKVRWSAAWNEGENAAVEYTSADGRSVSQPLIPSRLTVHRAADLPMDGDLSKWPAKSKLPVWVFGSTLGAANADVYLAWSPQGLYVGLDVRDSRASVPDPRSFWSGDTLELFVSTRDGKTARPYQPGDHQFWLAPMLDGKRVYVGQWKRNDEIPATRYDLPGIKSISVRKGNGYVMECLIPASAIQGFQPAAGAHLGLNINVSVKGATQDREVFWPKVKDEAVEQPANWGTVTLDN